MEKPSIEIPFALGQELWWIGNGYREEYITCPECLGSKFVTLILGNGEQYELDCKGCGLGYDPPSGKIKRIYYEHSPTSFLPRRVDISGAEIKYSNSPPESGCYSSVYSKDLFTSKAECEERCKELNIERTKEEQERQLNNLKSKRHDLAWSVHYWRGQRERYEKELALIEARLHVCMEKAEKKTNKLKS